MFLDKWIDQIGDWNPQLFRELKGRLTLKSLGLMALFSGVIQSLIYLSFQSSLPYPGQRNHHYCLGKAPAIADPNDYLIDSTDWCVTNAAKQVTNINWSLWWTELFITLTITGFFVVLIGGVYLLIQDIGKEQQRGTLNFVALSPQSATAIALGKILGVPTFIYGLIAFAFPLHFIAALRGGIPLHYLGLFYGVITACCLFFFSGALLYALVSQGGMALKSWLGTGALFYLTSMTTMFVMHERVHVANVMDGVILLNPLHMLVFLVRATPAAAASNLFNYDNLGEISFYGVYLWANVFTATLAHLVIFGMGTYWFAQAFKRKFHNAQGTLITKRQSYWLTASLTIFSLGFTVQEPYSYSNSYNNWLVNFVVLTVCASLYLLLLIVALSPGYQFVQDWSRFEKHTLREWCLGERSPALWAIAINSGIVFIPTAIAGVVVMESKYRGAFVLGMILQTLVVTILAAFAIYFLLQKHKKRHVSAGVMTAAAVITPFLFFGVSEMSPEFYAAAWFWTITPLVAVKHASLVTILTTVLGQLTAIATLNQLIKGRIKRIGSSELKQLLDQGASPLA